MPQSKLSAQLILDLEIFVENPSSMNCTICFNEYTTSSTNHSLLARFPCEHSVCVRCAAKMLVFYGDSACSQCKEKGRPKILAYRSAGDKPNYEHNAIRNEKTITIKSEMNIEVKKEDGERGYSTSKTTSLASMPHLPLDDLVYYESENVRVEANRLFEAKCTKCEYKAIKESTKKNYSLLSLHYKSAHKILVCNICMNSNRFFPDELTHYNMSATSTVIKSLISHKKVDHFYCTFCDLYFFDFTGIKAHCIELHQICSICQILRKTNRYFQDYAELEKHYQIEHFCCEETKCRANHTFAFAHASELVVHYKIVHKKDRDDILLHRKHTNGISSVEDSPKAMDLTVDQREIFDIEGKKSSLHGIMSRLKIKEANDGIIGNTKDSMNNGFDKEFPAFGKATNKVNSQVNIPSYLDRSQLELTRLRRLQNISKEFCGEIDHCIREYNSRKGSALSNYSSELMLVQELQELVSQDDVLRVLELILKKDNGFVKKYRKDLEFPKFEGKKDETHQNTTTCNNSSKKGRIGFKVINLGKK